LYSRPSGATVQLGSKVQGETPCKIKIPADSILIKDNHVEITYSFDDGRRFTRSYDLRKYEPPNKLAGKLGMIIAAPGIFLISLTETDEDDKYTSFDKEDSDENDREVQLIALGLIGLGAFVYYVFGGDSGVEGYDIFETFDDVNDVSINKLNSVF
jgi:hypothetical protein